jgi:CMP-N,N'-diacetyllegionaminic acid synthase
MTEVLAIIPARGGSKGVYRKNIKQLNGTPLIEYTIQAAKQSSLITRYMVSTEDEEIADVSRSAGADVPFLRPKSLAQDDSKVIDTCMFVLEKLKQDEGYEPNIVILLQPTSPLRKAHHLDEAIRLYIKKSADSVLSVCEVEHPPSLLLKISQNGGELIPLLNREEMFKNRQEFEKTYTLNGAIYVFSPHFLREELSFYGEKTYPYLMSVEESIDIDTEIDFELASILLKKGKL